MTLSLLIAVWLIATDNCWIKWAISLSKSLLSDNGTLEFAKRYRVKGLYKDLSPVSLQALLTCRTTLGLCQLAYKYKVASPNTLFRLAGAGFRVRSPLYSTNRSRKWQRLWTAATIRTLPLEWWGKPLNPYLRRFILGMLRKELKPKELRVVPNELTFDGEREYTLLHNCMKEWLKWLHWYHAVALSPDPSLRALFEAPICSTSWKRSNFDKDFFQYGLIWECYDMGAGRWSKGWCPAYVLPSLEIRFDRWILGGYRGTDFLMAPVDHQSAER